MQRIDWVIPLVLIAGASSCDSKQNDAAPSATPAATAQPTQAPSAKPAAGGAPSGSAASGAPADMPSDAEWATAQAARVAGAAALGCEGSITRNWLRVLCAKKNDSGGTPTAVEIGDVKRLGPSKTAAAQGQAVLFVKIQEGLEFSAKFAWTDKKKTLYVKWPEKTPQPETIAEFKD